MLSFLRDIIEVIEYIPQYIMYAVESLWNVFEAAIMAVWVAASTLIGLPEEPAPPAFISSINWFFPIGAVITVMTPVVIGYASFLAVRWIFSKVGDL